MNVLRNGNGALRIGKGAPRQSRDAFLVLA